MKLLTPARKKALTRVMLLLLWVSMLSGFSWLWYEAGEEADAIACKKVYIALYPLDIHFYNRQRVLEILRKGIPDNKKLVGTPMGQIDVSRLEKVLRKEPFVEDAEVFADMNGTLQIRVQQRKPVVRVMRYDGTQFYIDRLGVKMPLSEHYTCRVPFANGNIFERYEKGDTVYSFVGNQLYRMAAYVDNHSFHKALIDQIFVRADNELVLVPRIGSRYIIFGDAAEPDKKFRKLLIFYREGLNRIGWNKYSSIDLRFDGQVICKK